MVAARPGSSLAQPLLHTSCRRGPGLVRSGSRHFSGSERWLVTCAGPGGVRAGARPEPTVAGPRGPGAAGRGARPSRIAGRGRLVVQARRRQLACPGTPAHIVILAARFAAAATLSTPKNWITMCAEVVPSPAWSRYSFGWFPARPRRRARTDRTTARCGSSARSGRSHRRAPRRSPSVAPGRRWCASCCPGTGRSGSAHPPVHRPGTGRRRSSRSLR